MAIVQCSIAPFLVTSLLLVDGQVLYRRIGVVGLLENFSSCH